MTQMPLEAHRFIWCVFEANLYTLTRSSSNELPLLKGRFWSTRLDKSGARRSTAQPIYVLELDSFIFDKPRSGC
jgi:hypothetical protein